MSVNRMNVIVGTFYWGRSGSYLFKAEEISGSAVKGRAWFNGLTGRSIPWTLEGDMDALLVEMTADERKFTGL
jgi:hypothetical protein